jgi:hypothetical protein
MIYDEDIEKSKKWREKTFDEFDEKQTADLLYNANLQINKLRDYNDRLVHTTRRGWTVRWSNGAERWNLSEPLPPGDHEIQGDKILIEGNRANIEKILPKLMPHPMYGNSFEVMSKTYETLVGIDNPEHKKRYNRSNKYNWEFSKIKHSEGEKFREDRLHFLDNPEQMKEYLRKAKKTKPKPKRKVVKKATKTKRKCRCKK